MAKLLVKLIFWLGMFVLLLWGLDQAYPYMPRIWQHWVLDLNEGALQQLRRVYEGVA